MSNGDRGGAHPWRARGGAGQPGWPEGWPAGWPGWPATLRILAAAAVLLAAVTGAGLLIGSDVLRFDRAVITWMQRMRSDGLTAAWIMLTNLGSLWTLGPAVVLAAAWLALRHRFTAAVTVLVVAIGGVVLTNAGKALVGRFRPPVDALVAVDSPSFPSGHAAQSAAILLVLALVLTRRRSTRAAALVVAVGLALGIGLTRVYLGVHYPSDVLAGWLLGGLWAAATVRLLGAAEPRRPGSVDRTRAPR